MKIDEVRRNAYAMPFSNPSLRMAKLNGARQC